jgi:predicted rRNA methylase YqxC with S4 and FtsJ domains
MKNHMFQAIDGNHVKLSSSIEILFKVPSMIKTNVRTLKPKVIDERLNLQCGKV